MKKSRIVIGIIILVGMSFILQLYMKSKTEDNPFTGKWLGEGDDVGYFEFTEDEFKWYRSKDDLSDNYYYGTYAYVGGALKNNGEYDYGEEGSEIYTMTMKYLGSKVEGTITEQESDGAFTIQKFGSDDSFYVYNHRTSGTFAINRMEE